MICVYENLMEKFKATDNQADLPPLCRWYSEDRHI
jgi:hypothetical protein